MCLSELIEVDLEDPAGAAALVDTAAERLGPIDALVIDATPPTDAPST